MLRIFKNPAKHITTKKGEIIDAIEFILSALKRATTNRKFKTDLARYIQSRNEAEIKLNTNPSMSFIKIETIIDIIEKLVKNYFMFANELIYNELYFLGIFKEENFLIPIEVVDNIVREPEKFNLPVIIEIEISRFYQLLAFRYDIQIKNTFLIMENYYKLDIHKNNDVKNIVNYDVKADKEKFRRLFSVEEAKMGKFDITLFKILNSSVVMTIFLKRFEGNMKKLGLSFKSPLNKKLKLLYYFENCIVRPFYIIVNLFMKNKSLINGDSSYTFYEMSFLFLKCVVYFYENVNSNGNLVDEAEASLIRKIISYDFKEVLVKQDLEGNIISEITDDIILIKDEFIKYFQLNCIYEICILSIKKIIKSGMLPQVEVKEDENVLPNPRSNARSEVMNLLTQNNGKFGMLLDYGNFFKKGGEVKPKEIQNVEKIVEKYKKKNEKYNGDSRAFIKILEMTDSDYDIDLRKLLFDYLQNKLADKVTYFDLEAESNFKFDQFNEINIATFKFQNSYCVYFLNTLFTHDSEGFQESLSDQHEDENFLFSEIRFLKFIMYYFIFANTLSEVNRLDELDYSNLKESIGYKLCVISVKLIQNLCEGHNVTFQNQFFNFVVFSKNEKESFNSKAEDKISTQSFKRIPTLNEKEEIDEHDKKSEHSKNEGEEEDEEEESEEEEGQKNIEDKEKIEKEIKLLEENKIFSFLNFISGNMRIIHKNLKGGLLRNYDHILEIYQRFTDLIIEMIQGTDVENFHNFYKKVKDYEAIASDGKINEKKLIYFQFLMLINETRNAMFDDELLLDALSLKSKTNLFAVINNLINGSVIDQETIKFFVFVFEPEKLIDLISRYLRSLYIKHLRSVDYSHLNFKENFQDLELNKECFDELYLAFKTNSDFYEDEFFKFTSQLYLFLTILGERYGINEAQKVLNLYKKDLQVIKVEEDIANLRPSGVFNKIKDWIKEKILGFSTEDANRKIQEQFKKKQKFNINNMIIASKFYNKIIRSCEFVIKV
jgi:hypothetical protein